MISIVATQARISGYPIGFISLSADRVPSYYDRVQPSADWGAIPNVASDAGYGHVVIMRCVPSLARVPTSGDPIIAIIPINGVNG